MNLMETEMVVREYIASQDADSSQYVSERDIAERFKMNRSNSRKLLMKLEGEGLLECLPQRGYRRVDYSNTTNRTFFTVRSSIESEAARLAAERAGREDILRLMLILDDADAVLKQGELKKFPRLDGDFHRALVNASHDNMLKKLFSFIYIPTFCKSVVVEYAFGAHEAHRKIFEAVRNHDSEEAMRMVHAHIGGMITLESKIEVEQ